MRSVFYRTHFQTKRVLETERLKPPMSTSSADLWIASNYCTSLTGCSSTVPLFNSSLSQTQVDMNTSFSVRYGSGQAQGEMMQDYVAFAGYNVSSQAFALVESVSRDLLGGDISGLMGESPPPRFSSLFRLQSQ